MDPIRGREGQDQVVAETHGLRKASRSGQVAADLDHVGVAGPAIIDEIEPGVRSLVRTTVTGRVGVIGTVGTMASGAYVDAVALDMVRKPWDFDVLVTENKFLWLHQSVDVEVVKLDNGVAGEVPLDPGDKVKTGSDGLAEVYLDDKGAIYLSRNTEFEVSSLDQEDAVLSLTVGSLVCGTVCSVLGYFLVQGVWRWNLMRQIRLRRARYRSSASGVRTPSSKRQT